MTVTAAARRAGPYTGGTSFPFSFKVYADTDVQVIRTSATLVDTTLTLDADYTVTRNPDQAASPGGSVTYTGLAGGEKLTILSNLPNTQGLALTNAGAFYGGNVETALDKTMIALQQLLEKFNRAVLLPVYTTLTGITFPIPEVGRFIRGNASATGYENADIVPLGGLGLPVSLANGGTNATTAPNARTNLGVPYASIAQTKAGTDAASVVTPDDLAALWQQGTDIATATTLVAPADANKGGYYNLTGAVDFSSGWTGEAAGTELRFKLATGGGKMLNSATLLTPKGVNIVLGANDKFTVVVEASNVWRVKNFERASGEPLISQGVAAVTSDLLASRDTIARIKISAGEILLKGANGVIASRVMPVTYCDIAESGISGLHTGAEAASTWYAAWVIDREVPIELSGGTADDATDTITFNAHGLTDNTPFVFTANAPTGLVLGTVYYVRNAATNTFKVGIRPGAASVTTFSSNNSGVAISTSPAVILASESVAASGLTLPSGYTLRAKVSRVRNDAGSSFEAFTQTNKDVFVPPAATPALPPSAAGVTDTYQPLSLANYVPADARIVTGRCGSTDTGTQNGITVAGDTTGIGAQSHNSDGSSGGLVDGYGGVSNFAVPMPTPQQIAWKATVVTATSKIDVTGYRLG